MTPFPVLLFLPQTTYAFDMVKGVADYAQTHETKWDIIYSGIYRESVFRQLAMKSAMKGVIGFYTNQGIVELFQKSKTPIVNVSARLKSVVETIPSIVMDNRMIGQLAAKHFIDRGYPEILFVRQGKNIFFDQEREAGFRMECEQHGVRYAFIEKDDLLPISFNQRRVYKESVGRKIKALLEPYRGRSGIVVLDDFHSFKVAEMLQHLGYQIPLDFALLGCNNEEHICLLGSQGRSSIEVNGKTIGYEAAAVLHRILKGEKGPTKPIFVRPGDVVVRQSTDILCMEDEVVEKALDFMVNNVAETIRVNDIARVAGVSRRVLEMRFKKFFRQPIAKKMVEIRINKVKSLLQDSHITITQIAELAGFSSSQRLAAVFRKYTGMTLSKYRHGVIKK